MFHVYQTDKGNTTAVTDPRFEAYKHVVHARNLDRRYFLSTDGKRYTVAVDGFEAITFEKIDWLSTQQW